MYGCIWLCRATCILGRTYFKERSIHLIEEHVWLCRALYGYVWVCTAMYGYVGLCRAVYGYVWLCMDVYGYVWLCMAM